MKIKPLVIFLFLLVTGFAKTKSSKTDRSGAEQYVKLRSIYAEHILLVLFKDGTYWYVNKEKTPISSHAYKVAIYGDRKEVKELNKKAKEKVRSN
jgi:hypothetical protein